jgi:hypothetical protein
MRILFIKLRHIGDSLLLTLFAALGVILRKQIRMWVS